MIQRRTTCLQRCPARPRRRHRHPHGGAQQPLSRRYRPPGSSKTGTWASSQKGRRKKARYTLFVAIARLSEGLFVETDFLDGVAVEAGGAVSPRDDIDIFAPDLVGDVGRVLDYTRILEGGVGPHADVVETDGSVEVEPSAGGVCEVSKVGGRLALVWRVG